MNFCCSDDYTETGSFLTDDIDIYSAFQAYLVGSSNVFPDLEEFKTYYENLVSSGLATSLGNEIKHLPEMDCADFTETGVIVTDDVNIFSAYQAYLVGTGGIYPTEISEFTNYYSGLIQSGLAPELTFPTKHLPTKDADLFVISDQGLIQKTGCSCTIIDTVISDDDYLNLKIDLSTIDPSTTNGNIKALEVIFDDVEFKSGATADTIKIRQGNPAIEADWDELDSTITNRLKKYTNVYYDYGRRLNGNEPTKKLSNFGFLDLDGDGINYTENANNILNFYIPYENIDEEQYKIVEVRIYDTSCLQNLFNIIECI